MIRGAGQQERAQSSLFVMVAVVMVWSLGVAAAHLADRVAGERHVAAIADSAALAGAIGGQARASEVAAANGATLVGFGMDAERVWVRIRWHGFDGWAAAHAQTPG